MRRITLEQVARAWAMLTTDAELRKEGLRAVMFHDEPEERPIQKPFRAPR